MRQFLDIGTGIPTAGNVHEVAQEIAPESWVLYFDPAAMAALAAASEQGEIANVPRSLADTERFFAGLELVEPGLVPLPAWRPDPGATPGPTQRLFLRRGRSHALDD